MDGTWVRVRLNYFPSLHIFKYNLHFQPTQQHQYRHKSHKLLELLTNDKVIHPTERLKKLNIQFSFSQIIDKSIADTVPHYIYIKYIR